MIIIEGADQVGKTTFANALARRMSRELYANEGLYDRVYRHLSRPPADFDHFNGYVERVGPHVWDRFHLGAIAYGKLLGHGGCGTPKQMLWVQKYLRWQGAIVIILHADRWWLKEHLDRTRDEMYTHDLILDVNDIFRMLSKNANHGELYCDFEHDVTDGKFPDDKMLEQVMEAWRERWMF